MFHDVARKRVGRLSADESQRLSEENVSSKSDTSFRHTHIAVLGTGFSGLGMAIRLKQGGYDDFVVIEKATDIGGTWRDNTYPGCACDIPSQLYSFSFAPNPNWSHMYPSQPEIRDYLRHCADRFEILPHILWNNAVTDASWHDNDQRWHITTSQQKLTADIFICGNGPLNEPSFPVLAGIERFKGTMFHSSRWSHDCDLRGKRVGVIGTGASSIQFVPRIQPLVSQLFLFQRTPAWIVPRLDRQIEASEQARFRLFPILQRFKRLKIYLRNEVVALGLIYRPTMMKTWIKFAQTHLERQVPDPILRAKLTPNYAMGCKRILVSNDFYPALSHPNINVITEHIREVSAHSIVMADGQEHEIDVLICGTGFHVTDTQLPGYIHGRDGQTLGDIWQAHPSAYLGTTVTGFPNLFLMIGPNTGLGHNSMVYMIESQIAYILNALHFMERRKLQAVEVRQEAQSAFREEMQRRMRGTAWTSGCSSWYLDSRGHNTTLWPGFTFEYRHRTRYFDASSYILA